MAGVKGCSRDLGRMQCDCHTAFMGGRTRVFRLDQAGSGRDAGARGPGLIQMRGPSGRGDGASEDVGGRRLHRGGDGHFGGGADGDDAARGVHGDLGAVTAWRGFVRARRAGHV
ncbi:hypothetical protein GCM10023100_48520 [Actinocorallia cavernae]|uniref:Uncharacterized protein n=2 Tax=Actinomycetes TaxID=1760 RepID=A0ABP5ZPD6_9ACTN